MAVSTGNIKELLYPGLLDVTGDYEKVDPKWRPLFKKVNSKQALERTVSMRFLGLPQLKTEGAGTQFDNNSGQRFVYNMEPVEVGLGYAITKRTIDDNQYASAFKPTNLGLMDSFAEFKNIEAASIFNFCATQIAGLGGDGVPLASTAHPVDGSTWANTPAVQVSLNEAGLLAAQVAIPRTFVNEAGLKINATAKTLIVSPENEATAVRLTQAKLRPGTNFNDPNAILEVAGGLPGGYVVLPHITSAFHWHLKTNIEGLIYLERKPFETSMWVDDYTDNLMVKGYERYGFFYNDPRALYCNTPTS